MAAVARGPAMLRSVLTILLLCALSPAGEEGFVAPRRFWRPYANRYGIVVMAGNVEGQQPHYGWYWNDTSLMYRFLVDEGFPKENVYFLAYGDKAKAAKGMVRGASTTGEIRRVFERVAKRAGKDDLVYLYWIDHGTRRSFDTYDGAIGHDEIGRLVRAIPARVFIGAFNPCNSGAVIDDIRDEGAIILTSVRPNEGNAWGWAAHWIEALAGGKRGRYSDFDLDGRITIAEAYEWTATLANRAREHPLIDDNGDGLAGDLSKDTFGDAAKDGARASRYTLDAWQDTYPACLTWRRAVLRAGPADVEQLEAFLGKQDFVRNARGEPILIYGYCREGAPGKLARQAAACRALNRSVFLFPEARAVPLVGRRFRCYEVDVSDLDPQESPVLNGHAAPLVIVLDRAGRLSGLMRETIPEALLRRELEKVLSEEQRRDSDRSVRALEPVLARVRGLAEKVKARGRHLAEVVARFDGRPLEDPSPARREARGALTAAEREHATAVDRLRAQLQAAEDARRAGVAVETHARCSKLIDALTTAGAPEAVDALLASARELFPVLIARLDDFRPMGVDHLSFATDPGAPEGLLHYGPEKVVDCLTIVLSMTSDQGFGSLHNGGTDEKRRDVIAKWRAWYAKAKPFLFWDPDRRRYFVDDAAWITGIPLEEYRGLSRERRSGELEKAFRARDRMCAERTGIAPAPARGELAALLDALRDDPYRPPSFRSAPLVSATMRKLAARGDEVLPGLAHAYHRTFDRPFAVSIIATLGELGGETAPKVLKAWLTFEHRQYLRYMIERSLRRR